MADKRPSTLTRSDTEVSSELDPEPENRSRSQSRRRRRQKQRSNQQPSANANALTSVKEESGQGAQASASAKSGGGMFERLGNDEDSMDGPVTYARAERGEIAPRSGMPNPANSTSVDQKKGGASEDEGLKLTLELNLEVELEIKASLHGDLTLALFA